MQRRKFFSFVSLFGISFTLMVMMVLISLYDFAISPNEVDNKRNQNLYLMRTLMQDSAKTYSSGNPLGFYYLKNYVKKLKTPDKITLFNLPNVHNAFVANKKLDLDARYTDAEYWSVFNFNFLEGRGYRNDELEKHDFVAVISQSARTNYFGKDNAVLGKLIEANNVKYRVIGVVEDVALTNIHASGDLYLPYTVSPENFEQERTIRGEFFGILQAKNENQLEEIRQEYEQMRSKIDLQSYHEGYDILNAYPDSYLGTFTRMAMPRDESEEADGSKDFFLVIGGLMFLFMLLPAINLVNLNITRIMERASEIGVRKAFGASDGTLVKQFLVENIIITLIGGLLGIILTMAVLAMLNASQFIPHAHLVLNFKIFLVGLGITLAFGLL